MVERDAGNVRAHAIERCGQRFGIVNRNAGFARAVYTKLDRRDAAFEVS